MIEFTKGVPNVPGVYLFRERLSWGEGYEYHVEQLVLGDNGDWLICDYPHYNGVMPFNRDEEYEFSMLEEQKT